MAYLDNVMPQLKSAYHAIYLSPHLDDAALSCGGQIYLKTAVSHPVLIVTIMAGDPVGTHHSRYAQELHTRWQLDQEIVAQRRREDVVACDILQADYVHLSVPDCIYRTAADGQTPLYADWAEITGDIHQEDRALIDALTTQFQQLPSCEYIFAPLGVGNHVDHQIVRLAAQATFGDRLRYYEDYPYAVDADALAQIVDSGDTIWQATAVPLTDSALCKKADAIYAYTSQISTFFHDRADLDEKIRAYTKQVGGERLWHKNRFNK